MYPFDYFSHVSLEGPNFTVMYHEVSACIQMGIFESKYPKVYLNHESIFDKLAVPEFMQLVIKFQCLLSAISL